MWCTLVCCKGEEDEEGEQLTSTRAKRSFMADCMPSTATAMSLSSEADAPVPVPVLSRASRAL